MLYFYCLLDVVLLFCLTGPWVGLEWVVVASPGHTRVLIEKSVYINTFLVSNHIDCMAGIIYCQRFKS